MLEEGVSPPTLGIAIFLQRGLEDMVLQDRAWVHCSGERSMYKYFIFDHCSEKLSSQFPLSILKCPWRGMVRGAVKLCSYMGGEEFQNTGKNGKTQGNGDNWIIHKVEEKKARI